MPRVLAPIDFSERSPGAARYAGMLACRFHSELTLLHVVDAAAYELSAYEFTGPVVSSVPEERSREAAALLDNFLPGEFARLNTRRVVLTGDPATEIVEFAHSERASLIVIPTHGYGPFRRFILGSVSAKILHDADCPVFTGAHIPDAPPDATRSFRNVLCAVDFCAQSEKALKWASDFAAEFESHLVIAHINPSLEPRGEYFDPDWRGCLERSAREKLEAMQKEAGTQAELLVTDSNSIPTAICEAASRIEADLVVIGRGSTTGMLGRLRTNAYSIIRQSPCPVVSV
ncbi:MAG TPA: universal stress protein [Bryobacteraceae bacterium]|nr:universal stress protein [Bryobacteraceae bacterium]